MTIVIVSVGVPAWFPNVEAAMVVVIVAIGVCVWLLSLAFALALCQAASRGEKLTGTPLALTAPCARARERARQSRPRSGS